MQYPDDNNINLYQWVENTYNLQCPAYKFAHPGETVPTALDKHKLWISCKRLSVKLCFINKQGLAENAASCIIHFLLRELREIEIWR